jgi:hypothetical protein
MSHSPASEARRWGQLIFGIICNGDEDVQGIGVHAVQGHELAHSEEEDRRCGAAAPTRSQNSDHHACPRSWSLGGASRSQNYCRTTGNTARTG